ncbi:MAG TPA: family 2A encapsulin nanocompartment cargo protein cysteine desulfurase [Planctomycetota bacterium]|nr:family 2A encapsulin nanocompartment cargo protein cysteine desulfurase [Planctomycetota bacterium]
MSTSSLGGNGLPDPTSDPLAASRTFIPDVATLARLANEFFTLSPGDPGARITSLSPAAPVPPSSALPPPSPAVPQTPASLGIPIPSETDLLISPDSSLDLGLFPAGRAAPGESDGSTYYFLDAPRNASRLEAPSQAEPRKANPPASSTRPSATTEPTVPATAPGSSYYFLDEAFALSRIPATPRQDNPDAGPGPVPDLKLPRKQFDVYFIRRDFPILREKVHGKPLIWLDNAATTQKPLAVIDRISDFYKHEYSNIHRAAHAMAARATDAYEAAREKVRRFLNAGSTREIIFVRGATEGINLVAQSWGRRNVGKDDEIVVTWIEHHSNIVPWQMLAAEKGAKLRVAPVDDDGQIRLDEYEKLLNPRTKIVAFTQVSNALGTVTPAKEMIEMAHRHGAKVLLDGAQAVSHLKVDVQTLDPDFYVFSGHKVFGPTGIGVVRGKEDLLNAAPPWQGGGNMIADVTFEKTVYNPAPGRFEAGTGNIADAVGLGAALDYLEQVGLANVSRHEHELMVYATGELRRIPGLRLLGTAKEKAGVLSFVLEGFRSEEVGAALDRKGIAVRSGHHCAQPALRRFGVETSVRPSLALYNTCEDIDALIGALCRLANA